MSSAPTIVMTQRGARRDFQESLRAKGVEVVQFDFLTPEAVAAYCYERGFLQVKSCPPQKAGPSRALSLYEDVLAGDQGCGALCAHLSISVAAGRSCGSAAAP